MLVNIAICDDSNIDIEVLKAALLKYDPYFNITAYSNGELLLEDCLENNKMFDLIFLDILMPKINGIDMARQIHSFSRNSKIIFVSSSSEHYSEAFDVFAFNYILKPINPMRLKEILDQAFVNIKEDRKEQINIFYKGSNYSIFFKEILYIESEDKKVNFYLTNGNLFKCYNKLNEVYKRLPEAYFVRCHQSYIINVIHVTSQSKDCFFIGDNMIKISKRYLKESKEKYLLYLSNINK